jgi:type IV pilus assembly protein PilQ
MNLLGQDRDGSIVVIATLASITQRQEEQAKAKETEVRAEDQVTQVVYLNYSVADGMLDPLKKLLSPRGDITVDRRTNTLIIRDIESNVAEVVRMAKTLDTQTPQVSIEARIVQVSPTFSRSLGVQWGANFKDIRGGNLIRVSNPLPGTGFGGEVRPSANTPPTGFAVNLPSSASFGGIGFSFGRLTDNPLILDLRLSAGESQGLTKIVSTPKITVLDNQEAKISQGESIPYATTSNEGTQTTFVDATISLTVTPHISADGGVVLKIQISKDAPGVLHPGADGPSIIKKEAKTNLLVKDGETIAVGGIQETTEIDVTSGIPFLMDIPIIGRIFRNQDKRRETSELMVFLTPKVLR